MSVKVTRRGGPLKLIEVVFVNTTDIGYLWQWFIANSCFYYIDEYHHMHNIGQIIDRNGYIYSVEGINRKISFDEGRLTTDECFDAVKQFVIDVMGIYKSKIVKMDMRMLYLR